MASFKCHFEKNQSAQVLDSSCDVILLLYYFANLIIHNNNTTNLISTDETFTPFHKLFVKMPHCVVPGCKMQASCVMTLLVFTESQQTKQSKKYG